MTQHHNHQDSSQPVDLRRYRGRSQQPPMAPVPPRPPVSPVSASWRRATDMTTSLTGWILRKPETAQPSRTFRVVSVLIVVCALMVLVGLVAATLFGDWLTGMFPG